MVQLFTVLSVHLQTFIQGHMEALYSSKSALLINKARATTEHSLSMFWSGFHIRALFSSPTNWAKY